ncbi:hypothetical protein K8B33_02865 [Alcanivorax sp. JB21]|uniref:hypothetical protein n=1 Tax=Alcanivorax limicola TaxID=2874102 RepID=UPI001CBA9D1D|nr:hypothetical protein [Alcanivorax limicola]MBZ2188024.1 hypothetical protein [Alcanivorax limicola]
MTKTQVERNFGKPEQTRPAVGQPPISRWVYGDFTVYFEGDYTLHAVSHHAPKPAPAVVSGSTVVTELPPIEEIDRADGAVTPDARPRFHFDPASGKMVELDANGQPTADATPAPEPAPEQAAQTAPEPAAPETPAAAEADEPRFRFDPATGRIVVDQAPADEAAQPAAEDTAPAAPDQPAPQSTPETTDTTEAPEEGDSDGGFFMQW